MAVFKCKMCGGSLEIIPGQSTAVCEYCGAQQTLPRLDDDRRANLYDRANHFRRANEFDKAESIYEQILTDDTADAEAYWSLVLCRYGIEYVDDPATHRRVPTVNRAQFTSIFEDDNYKLALQYADPSQRAIYEAEAAAINEIQKGILAISQKEQPFDVFICYKETDAAGRRTPDSVLANDLYYQLTQEGFRVFFSRITLEDKLGTAYEPYIFAALNSARVMVVLGTRPEYFNAVWVKNEWSRYLALVKKSGGKKVLIPAYKDMDPYDLPDEFSHLQAQDMSKLGFMQDLIRGIKKLTADEPKATAKETVVIEGGAANTAPLLKRAFMYLEDADWQNADAYCERVLDADPENAQAYLGKLLADLQCRRAEELQDEAQPFDENSNYQKALRFDGDKLKAALTGAVRAINERNEAARKAALYKEATEAMQAAQTQEEFEAAAVKFESLPGYEQADANAELCREKAETACKDAILSEGVQMQAKGTITGLEEAVRKFEAVPGWKDADERAHACKEQLHGLYAKREKERTAIERNRKIAKLVLIICAVLVVAGIAIYLLMANVVIPANEYNNAVALREAGDYDGAIAGFTALGDYKDAAEQISATYYAQGEALTAAQDFDGAVAAFTAAGDYGDAAEQMQAAYEQVQAAYFEKGEAFAASGEYWNAIQAFNAAGSYEDAHEKVLSLWAYIADRKSIACGVFNTFAIRNDNTVIVVGNDPLDTYDVSDWADIIDISFGSSHIAGLRSDGTVVASGDNSEGQCNTTDWKDIVAVVCGADHTIGLKSDGTVVVTGDNSEGQCNTSGWKDIIAVAGGSGSGHTIGLKSDGTVVATGYNEDGQCNVSGWKDIVAVVGAGGHTIGLKSDGTVVATGSNEDGKCNVSGWKDIVAVACGGRYTIGLKSDGTVVATGYNDYGQCNVSGWKDIVAVACGGLHTIGLKSDGTVVATGYNYYGQCNVSGWKNIRTDNY